ncbi:phage protease [Achromobacter seleniivolatilans]|uniref:Phage protease n=1 Tax=Achromobacter seleniivolatilans TaxID=3047478 RepID=A0ABY9M7W9_9BURK|nr:phage protease [Achromobacter sp. R39]WMD23093.1 phage protease [Achromobacter sp. R39]
MAKTRSASAPSSTRPAAAAAPMVAALSIALRPGKDGQAQDEIQVFPAGEFRASDGRPEDVDTWRMDGDIARALIARFNARNRRLVIDYEHQTLAAATNGQPAPASGWMVALEWREGEGVYARVDWKQRAQAYIKAEEYLYISPVFTYDKQGRPQDILHAALTNNPALDNMEAVRLAVASALAPGIAHGGAQLLPAQSPKESKMNELLKALFALLGLADDATEEQALAKLSEYSDKAKQDADQVAALTTEVENKKEEVAALTSSAGKPDPAKYVPIAALSALQAQVATLTTDQRARDVAELVTVALSANKLTPALKDWAVALGMKDPAQLKAYLDQAPAIAALSGTQTGGRQPGGNGSQLNDEQMAVCTRMGLDPQKYLKSISQD